MLPHPTIALPLLISQERELGLPVTPHLAKLDSEIDIVNLQLGFFAFVVEPLWNAAAQLFPGAEGRIEQLRFNRAMWHKEKTALLFPSRQMERANSRQPRISAPPRYNPPEVMREPFLTLEPPSRAEADSDDRH